MSSKMSVSVGISCSLVTKKDPRAVGGRAAERVDVVPVAVDLSRGDAREEVVARLRRAPARDARQGRVRGEESEPLREHGTTSRESSPVPERSSLHCD
jgi:hypothetical protein